MAERRRADRPRAADTSGAGRQRLESIVVESSPHAGPRGGVAPPAAEAELFDAGADWDFDESGIAEVPPELGRDGTRWVPSDEPAWWQHELEHARGEVERLRDALAQLRRERDQALRTALSVRRELTGQVETSRREASEAWRQAATADRIRRATAQKAAAKLHGFEQQIAELQEQVTAFQELLAALAPPSMARSGIPRS